MKRILLTAFSLLPFAAFAQTSLDSVIIEDRRLQIPYHENSSDIQILTRRDIEALPVKSVNELLAYAAATDVRQRGPWGTQADLGIDGSGFDEVLVLVDGIKLSDPQTGHHKLNLPIPLAAIERIEILRGPASRIYGIDALTGAINIVTRRPAHNLLSIEASAGSSFESDTATQKTYTGWGTQVTGALSGNRMSQIFSLSHQQGNGYRYNTAYDNYRLAYKNTIHINDKNTLHALGGYTNNDFGASLFYAAPSDNEATENVQTALAGLKWVCQPNVKLRITPVLSYRYNKDDYIYIRQKPEVYHNIHETNVASAEVNAAYKTGAGTAAMGVEWRQERINSNSLGKRERDNIGIYGGYEYRFSARLQANAGFYLNHNSDYGTQLLPGIEAGYDVSRHWRLSLNAGSGERQPTYTDLYYQGPTNIGNDTLRPEQAVYSEAMLRYHNAGCRVELSYGYRHISDFIDWVRLSDAAPWQPQNYAAMNTQIISLRASVDAGKQLHLSSGYSLVLHASYTHLEPTLSQPELLQTKYTLDVLRNKLVLGFAGGLRGKLQVNINARYQQRFNAADYWLLDARVAYHLRKTFALYADGNNLLNTVYYESGLVPLPGRWLSVGFRYELM